MTWRGRPLIPPVELIWSTARSVEIRISAPSIAPTPVMSSSTPILIGLPVSAGAEVAGGADVAAGGAAGAAGAEVGAGG